MEGKLQFLYRIRPVRLEMLIEGPTIEEDRAITHHFEYLKELEGKGVLILAGRTLNTDESCFGIVILRADSGEEARAVMEADPAVKADVMEAVLFPFRVALPEM
jgi:uncharacterized protein YciI